MKPSHPLSRWVFQASLAVVVSVLTIFLGQGPGSAQLRRIPITDDADIEAIFDVVYRPGTDPDRSRLQTPDEQEAYQLLKIILATGTQIYLRPSQDGNYGSYNVPQDILVLRPSALAHWGIFIETLRHEGWHVVQACVAAKQGDENLVPTGLRVSRRTMNNLYQNHSYAPQEIPVEAEAFEAEQYPGLTLKGLQRDCADWLNDPKQ